MSNIGTDPQEAIEAVHPTIDTDVRVLDAANLEDFFYTEGMRGPNDAILSGPIAGGWGPGRWHRNKLQAFRRLCGKFGATRVKWVRPVRGRWAFLIKDLKTKGAIANAA